MLCKERRPLCEREHAQRWCGRRVNMVQREITKQVLLWFLVTVTPRVSPQHTLLIPRKTIILSRGEGSTLSMLDFNKIDFHSYPVLRPFSRTLLTTQLSLRVLTLKTVIPRIRHDLHPTHNSLMSVGITSVSHDGWLCAGFLNADVHPHCPEMSSQACLVNILVYKGHIHSIKL